MRERISLISLIDDDRIFQQVTKKIIEESSLADCVLQFHDGEEAMHYLVAHRNETDLLPDVIFLDLNMPYMDGWQFLDVFKKQKFRKKMIIYIISSSISLKDQERARTYSSVTDYMVKPMSRTDFESLVKTMNLN
jgi:two-component system, chemotaxis family, chemotaxis protein CheY